MFIHGMDETTLEGLKCNELTEKYLYELLRVHTRIFADGQI
jgi:hypothetical protein